MYSEWAKYKKQILVLFLITNILTCNGVETRFTWDQAAALPQVVATSGGQTAQYLYGLELSGVQQGGQGYSPLADALGSLRQWTDAAGAVVGSASYDPFGGVLSQQGFTSPWGFAGEYHDPTTGLQYLRARWYQPGVGRFTQVDPFPGVASLPLTQNPYVYGLNNPTNLTDPTGKDPLSLAGTLIAGVVGGFVTGVGFYTIQVMLQAQVCSSTPQWDWRVALRWGLAGAAIGGTFVLTAWGLAELLNLGGLLFSGVLYETMPWLALAEARLAWGITGGTASAIGYAIPALAFGQFDVRELAVAFGVGAVFSAFPEIGGTGVLGPMLRGVVANEAQYVGSNLWTHTPISGEELGVNFVAGLFLGHFQGPSESPAFGRVRSFATGFAGERELAGKWAANFLRAMVDQGWKSATRETIRSSAWSFVNNLASFVAPYLIH